MSLLPDLWSSHLDNKAIKKENKLKQATLNRGADLSREAFDGRLRELGLSDTRIADLLRKEYGEGAANEDASFKDLLENNQAGFDEQVGISNTTADERLGIEKSAFDDQMEALGGLMTAQRGARLKMQEASKAERDRQQGFQAQADELAGALPGQIGYDAQEAGRAVAFGSREGLIRANTSATDTPAYARKDPTLAGAFATQDARGTTAGLGDALGQARISSRSDAYQEAERNIGDFATDISGLTSKAALSRSALPAELGVGKLEGEQAKERSDFATALAQEFGGKRSDIVSERGDRLSSTASDYRNNVATARSGFADKMQKVLGEYYGGQFDAEGNYIAGVSNASTNLESKLLNLNNFKMNNTLVTSPLANTIRLVDAAADKAAKAAAGGA